MFLYQLRRQNSRTRWVYLRPWQYGWGWAPAQEAFVISHPIDSTATSAWNKLAAHANNFSPDLRAWFAADPDRAERFTTRVGDLHVDLSKNLLTEETLALLGQLADEVQLQDRIDAMVSGAHITDTDDLAVLYTVHRRPRGKHP